MSGGLFDFPKLQQQLEELKKQMEDPSIWQDQQRAKKVGTDISRIEGKIQRYQELEALIRDSIEIAQLAELEGDMGLLDDLTGSAREAAAKVRQLELETLLSGEYDSRDAIVTLHAGAGGTEAMDWVSMLYRMYSRWAERKGFKVETLDILPGEEAGLKSVSFSVRGDYAYGFLRTEKGVHRLVRISPFDANQRRHTSFASVDVLPEIEEDTEIDIKPEELKIDTFRSSGAGGQHVNKTDSAVRITHIPTGIVVTCQNERSQHSNRLVAMRMLKAKLLALKEEERQKQIEALRGPHKEIAWGSQIRSYVFQPYTLVKDHRTGVEAGNVERVMDGDIDDFIYAKLRQDASG
ncbi:MAG TPA: peptide chain release factor 2 [Clostridiales bacterium UBA9857]|nr:peptide chain release factor 2 [Candidatus Fermentithermobacillaceae bacterium]HAF66560.1 peptide chain release factor 2 [Clostridiales bacterium UBA9857]